MKNEGNGMFEGKKWERGGYVGGREMEGYLEGNWGKGGNKEGYVYTV